MSVSCPIWRGYLSNVDSRWNILGQTTDDRTEDELKGGKINTSRYSCVSTYLNDQSEIYNDLFLHYDQNVYEKLIENGFEKKIGNEKEDIFL